MIITQDGFLSFRSFQTLKKRILLLLKEGVALSGSLNHIYNNPQLCTMRRKEALPELDCSLRRLFVIYNEVEELVPSIKTCLPFYKHAPSLLHKITLCQELFTETTRKVAPFIVEQYCLLLQS